VLLPICSRYSFPLWPVSMPRMHMFFVCVLSCWGFVITLLFTAKMQCITVFRCLAGVCAIWLRQRVLAIQTGAFIPCALGISVCASYGGQVT